MDSNDYLRKRLDADLSVAEVARRSGYSRVHVTRVENGVSKGSPSYEAAFLDAINGVPATGASTGGFKQPALRTQKLIATSSTALELAVSQLDNRLRSLNKARKTLEVLAAQVKGLTADVPHYDTEQFDPKDATDSEYGAVMEFMSGVMVEMLVDHKFHMLDEPEIRDALETLAKQTLTGIKKAKNRAVLRKFSID